MICSIFLILEQCIKYYPFVLRCSTTDGLPFQEENVFPHLSSGVYTIYVMDANNCIASEEIVIEASTPLEIEALTIAPPLGVRINSGTPRS